MKSKSVTRINETLRARQLSSPSHTGRYARDKSWEKIEVFAKRQWKALAFMIVFPMILSIPIVVLTHGPLRWLAVGVAGVSGFWLTGVFVVLWAGVANTLMGLVAEGYTSDTLRKFGGKKWHLVNGFKLTDKSDIDHILVGPGGLIVFETKWSGSRWPMPDTDDNYMHQEFSDAVDQVRRNRDRLSSKFGKVFDGMTIKAVCVLWSGQNLAEDKAVMDVGDIAVVRGPKLDSFMEGLDELNIAPQVVEKVWGRLKEHTFQRDKKDQEGPNPSRPAMGSQMNRLFVYPSFALAIPAYIFVGSTATHRWWAELLTLTALLVLGFILLKVKTLRPAAIVWILVTTSMCLFLAIYVAVHVIR